MILKEKYHLPHNSIRIDEFQYMLSSIDLSKKFYIYKELRLLFLKTQIKDDKLRIFHPAYHRNLMFHKSKSIRDIYNKCILNPSSENLDELLNCQYTPRKTFKQVFNETVRDYTEFFAFLGLLPTYYKGKSGGEKRHYVSNHLKEYISNAKSIEDLLFDFKYRNSSKDYDSILMYHIELRPFIVALKAAKKYFDLGYNKINNKILSAIVLFSKDENVDSMINLFPKPDSSISSYKHLFGSDFKSIDAELGRASLFLRPYLIHMQYLDKSGIYYTKGTKNITNNLFTERVSFCNSSIGNLSLTPVVGKILYKLYKASKLNIKTLDKTFLFDENINEFDKKFLLDELIQLKCILSYDEYKIYINDYKFQYSINPYTDFFDFDDSNYVENIGKIKLYAEHDSILIRNNKMESLFEKIEPIAMGSNGEKYEESIYNLIKNNFKAFEIKWLGANSTGKRLSDIYIKSNVFDGVKNNNIVIIIECKAGKSVRSFDERKEIDDVINTLSKEKDRIDGVWYWVVNGDSLPSIDEHGGYRNNDLSKSFMEKLNEIQFSISEYMRVPTIVTAFSFNAIKNYICYLYDQIGETNTTVLNRVNVPHFWRWSKKFMNLQYVMVHKELRLNA